MSELNPAQSSTDAADVSRRAFIRRAAACLGAAGACACGAQRTSAAERAAPAARKTFALLPDGQLTQVDMGPDAPPHRHLPPSDPAVRRGVPGRKWIMVIDLAKCDGCKKCTAACNKMHHTPADREWIKVFQMEGPHETKFWFPKPCFHCDNPPCTKVCPVDATFKRDDGVVLIDNERCIGCRFCMAACPYSTRFFNWGPPRDDGEAAQHAYSPETGFPRKVGTVEKCDFCPDLAAQGILPPCVTTCAMGAVYYGDENEDAVTNAKGETERLHQLLEDRAAYRYMEELGTKPRVYYLPPKNRAYPAPGAHAHHEEAK